jgi:hypothetical protein
LSTTKEAGHTNESKLPFCPFARSPCQLLLCRTKALEEGPHTQKEAEEAVGLGRVDNGLLRKQGEAMEVDPPIQDVPKS